MRVPVALVALLAFAGTWPAAPARAGTDQPAGINCVGEEGGGAEEARVAQENEDDDDEGAPPTFSRRFFSRSMTLDASLDGLEGRTLPVAVEEVCDLPKALTAQAAQLAGSDGLALVRMTTVVTLDGRRLRGSAATSALGGADTAVLKVRLLRARLWRRDEEGERVPTFSAQRIRITD